MAENRFIRKLTGRSARNSGWIISERILSVGITTIVTILSARYLGVVNYGILSYGLTLVTLFAGIMKLGIDSIIVNELINHKRNQGSLLGTSIILRVVSSIISVVSIGLIAYMLNSQNEVLVVVSAIQAFILLFQAIHVLDYWFQSQLKSKYVSIAKIVATGVSAIYSLYILTSDKGIVWFAASTTLTAFVIAVLLLAFYCKQGGDRLDWSWTDGKYLLSKSHHFIIANMMAIVYVQIDKLMVGNMIGSKELGIYSAALLFCAAWVFIPDAIITSLRPSILNARLKSKVLYLRRLKQLYFVIFWISMAFSLVIALLAPLLVSALFGAEYTQSTLVLQIAIWYVPVSILGTARNIWLVSEDKGRYTKYILGIGLVVNIALNLVLLPQIGIVGAAITTLVTELVTCFVAPLIFKETRVHNKILLEALTFKH